MPPPMDVIVNCGCWLPVTENWVYTQVANLPSSVRAHIVCRETRHADRFPVERLHSYAALTPAQRCAVLWRGARRLGRHIRRRSALMAEVAAAAGVRVVHSHFGYTGYATARAIDRLGLGHVVTFYGVDMSALPSADPRWLDRYAELFDRVDRVLCEGQQMAAQVRRLGCPGDKLTVHPLGVDTASIPFRPREWQPGAPLRVLMAASFREKKGIPYGIRALAQVAQRVPVALTLIGDAGQSPAMAAEKTRVHNALAETGLNDRVRMLGYQPRERLLEEAYGHHLFLAPSITASDGDTEGGAPVAIIEMAATGMPVVSSRHADIPGVIRDGVGGLLAEERDVGGLADCLEWLVKNPGHWPTLATAAREHIEQYFDARIQAHALGDIYRSVASEAGLQGHGQ